MQLLLQRLCLGLSLLDAQVQLGDLVVLLVNQLPILLFNLLLGLGLVLLLLGFHLQAFLAEGAYLHTQLLDNPFARSMRLCNPLLVLLRGRYQKQSILHIDLQIVVLQLHLVEFLLLLSQDSLVLLELKLEFGVLALQVAVLTVRLQLAI